MGLTRRVGHALLALFSEISEGEEKNSTLPRNGQGFLQLDPLRLLSSTPCRGHAVHLSCLRCVGSTKNSLFTLIDVAG